MVYSHGVTNNVHRYTHISPRPDGGPARKPFSGVGVGCMVGSNQRVHLIRRNVRSYSESLLQCTRELPSALTDMHFLHAGRPCSIGYWPPAAPILLQSHTFILRTQTSKRGIGAEGP